MEEQLAPRGAQRTAHRDLFLPRGAASEQQVGNIGACDQQHECDGAEQNPQRADDIAIEKIVLQRLDGGAPALIRFRVVRGDLSRHRVHVGVGLRDRDARLEPRHHQNPVIFVVDEFRFERQRYVQLTLHAVGRAGRQHADDRVLLAIHADLLADDMAIAAEPILPELVGQNRFELFAKLPFFGKEVAAEQEGLAEHMQKAWSTGLGVDLFGMRRTA